MMHPDTGRRVRLPNPHGSDEVSDRLLAEILRQAGISRDEWDKLGDSPRALPSDATVRIAARLSRDLATGPARVLPIRRLIRTPHRLECGSGEGIGKAQRGKWAAAHGARPLRRSNLRRPTRPLPPTSHPRHGSVGIQSAYGKARVEQVVPLHADARTASQAWLALRLTRPVRSAVRPDGAGRRVVTGLAGGARRPEGMVREGWRRGPMPTLAPFCEEGPIERNQGCSATLCPL